MKLFIPKEDEILDGKITDVYFDRTLRTLSYLGIKDVKVRMEFHSYGLPKNYNWGVFAGLEEGLKLLEGKSVTIYAMPEGTLFKEIEPVMIIEGNYVDFGIYETALLGILRQESSIATKAARLKSLAMDKSMIFFGLRALHPASSIIADRSAYIGGMDGVSGLMSKEYLGLEPSGTMPHALMLILGDDEKAWEAFNNAIDQSVQRIALVDTFEDERFAALKAAKLLGDKLYGIRLDTPSSRRGNFRKIVQEVRWTLDINGFRNVKILVSGGIDEEDVMELKDYVDGFGIGTSVAFPQSVDFSADIVEKYIDGKWIPFTKRGKWPGAKQVWRCNGLNDTVTLLSEKIDGCTPLLKKYMDNGKILEKLPSVSEIRQYVISQLKTLNQ